MMSYLKCHICGTAVNLPDGQTETKCPHCETLVKPPEPLANTASEPSLPPSVVALIRQGDNKKIAAIQELRSQRPGLGLAEAKKIVEDEGLKLGTMTASKSGCFIATACYGDYNHPVVIELRQFRDEILQPAKAGQVFIHWYYEWSPTFASFVAKNGILKTIVRFAIVAPVVFAIRIAKNIKRMNNL